MDKTILHHGGRVSLAGDPVTSNSIDQLPSDERRRAALHLASGGEDDAAQAWLDAHPVPRSEEIGARLRGRGGRRQGQHGSPAALGIAIGACLRSGDPLLKEAARDRILAALEGRTRDEAARRLGVSLRSLLRWLAWLRDHPAQVE